MDLVGALRRLLVTQRLVLSAIKGKDKWLMLISSRAIPT